eukprot:14756095-Ditylum_brightwellii.AAC.1
MLNLFKAYLVAFNSNCVRYNRTKKDIYNHSAYITIDTLMSQAKMNYQILKQQGTWNTTSPEQEKIVALASIDKKLKDDNLKLSQQVKSGGPYRKQKKYTNKGKDKSKAMEVISTKRKVRPEDAWKQVAPKTGEAQTNTVSSKS